MEARERRMRNFSVLSLLKTTEPAVRALVDAPQMRECRIDGFLCPGHVAVITGADSFAFLPEEYGLPAVVSGFEPEDLVVSVYLLVKMLAEGRPALVNEYARLVRGSGNPAARKAVDAVFAPRWEPLAGAGGDIGERSRDPGGICRLGCRQTVWILPGCRGGGSGLPLR